MATSRKSLVGLPDQPEQLENQDLPAVADPLKEDFRTLTQPSVEEPWTDPELITIDNPPPDTSRDEQVYSSMLVPSDVNALQRSKQLFDRTNQAIADGDDKLAHGYLQEQRFQAAVSETRVTLAGGDPARVRAPNAQYTAPHIELERQMVLYMEKQAKLREVFQNPEFAVQDFNSFLGEVMEQYKEKNGAKAFKPMGQMTLEQQIEYQDSLDPVTVDPNLVAEWRQKLVKLDQAMKATDPENKKLSVFTHPETARFANWISREAGANMPGYLRSGEQPSGGDPNAPGYEGEPGIIAKATLTMAEGVTDLGLNLLYGAYDMSGRYIESVTDGRVGWAAPTNIIQGDDGKLYTNAGKVPGIIETFAAVRAAATGQNIYDYVGGINRAREMEMMKQSGFDSLIEGISGVYGMAFGFGIPAGAAMRKGMQGANLFGSLTLKGLQKIGAGGVVTGAMTPKVMKLTRIMANTAGAAVGLGAMEGLAFGRHEGYGKAFMGGMYMAPILMVFGASARGLDKRMLNRKVVDKGVTKWIPRKHMPAALAHAVSGGLEGVGFGTLELYQTDSIWDFITDPTEEHWMTYAKNVAGFGIFKMMHQRGALEMPAEAAVRRIAQREARARFGEKVSSMMGQKRATGAQRPAAKQGPMQGPPVPPMSLREEIAKIRSEPQTPESRKRVVELMEEQRGKLTEAGGEFFGKLGAQTRRAEVDWKGKGKPEPRREEPAREEPARDELEPLGKLEGMTGAERTRELERMKREDLRDKPVEPAEFEEIERGIEESGMPAELLESLGEANRLRRTGNAREAADAAERMKEINQELDALEAAQEPLTASRIRELESKGLVEAEGELEVRPPAPGPRGGTATGGSAGPAASPYRQLEKVPGTKPIRASDIINTFEGRQGVGGLSILGMAIGRVKGTAVQLAHRTGRMLSRRATGVYKIFEHMTRSQAGLDLVTRAHEWSHGMMRQVLFGESTARGGDFQAQSKKWYEDLTPEERADVHKILSWYGKGPLSLRQWQRASEAWAEWFARDLLGDETLYNEVPALSKKLLAWLAEPGQAHLAGSRKSQYRLLQSQLARYNLQGSRERTGKSVRRGFREFQGSIYENLSEGMKRGVKNIVHAFYDDMIALKQSQAKWMKIAKVNPADLDILDNPAALYDALRMTASRQSENFLHRFTHTLGFKRVGESLKEILNSDGIKNRKIDFVDYIVAVRALNLLNKGVTQTLPKQDYLQTIKELESPKFEEAARRLKVWSDSLLDLVAEAGNLAPSDVQAMKDYSLVYLPFVRAIGGPRPSFGGRGTAEKGTGLKAMRGDTSEIRDPIAALQDVTRSMITKAHQYMVMRSLYRLSMKAEVGGLATIVPRKMVPSRFRIRDIFNEMRKRLRSQEVEEQLSPEEHQQVEESLGILGEILAENIPVSDAMLTLFGQKSLPMGEKDAIIAFTPRMTPAEIAAFPKDRQGEALRNNNKMIWMELDVPAYEALMGIDQPIGPQWIDLPVIKQLIGYPVKWTRFFATNANPAFAAANMLRDALSQPIFDKEGKFIPFSGFYKMFMGAAELFSRGEYAQMYEASGAAVGSLMNEGSRRALRGQTSNILKTAREGIYRALNVWEGWIAKPESFLRIYEFKKAYEKAKAENKGDIESAFRALEAAREITVNFARGGIVARALNQAIPYFNASLQGQRKMIRSLAGMEGTTDKQRARIQIAAFANGLTNITIPTAILWSLFKDESWYKDLPEWRKLHYWNVRFSDDGPIISVPKPFELGILFGTIPQIWMDKASDGNPIALAPTIGEMVLPYMRGWGSLVPTTFKAPLELYTGKDFFTGRQLTPYWTQKSNEPQEQVRQSTSEMAKLIFDKMSPLVQLMGVDNPIELEQLISGYSAGAGTTALRMVDEIGGLRDHPGILPGMAAPLSSFYNRFARQTAHGSSRTVREMYEEGDRLQQKSRKLTPMQAGRLSRINSAKTQMSQISDLVSSGRMDRDVANQRRFRLANQIMRTVK